MKPKKVPVSNLRKEFFMSPILQNNRSTCQQKDQKTLDLWGKLTRDQAKTALMFHYYAYTFKKVWVSDSTIGSKCKLSRVKINVIKNHKLNGLVSVYNRGPNRTCITRVRNNVFNNPDLIYYLMNHIKALAGVFKYHFTRFIKISYMKILSNTFLSPNNRLMASRSLATINILHEFNKILNNGRFSKLKNLNFNLKQEIALGVFPLSALRYANSIIGCYPFEIMDKFALAIRLCDHHVKLNNIETMSHLRHFVSDMFNNVKFVLKSNNVDYDIFINGKKDLVKKELPKSDDMISFMNSISYNFVTG